MRLTQLLATCLAAVLLTTAGLFTYHALFATKVAYIDIKKVFEGFAMKKELEEKYKQVEKGRSKVLDSLSLNLKVLSKHLNEQKERKADIARQEIAQFEYAREEYLKLQQQFKEDNAALSRKYDGQILEQLTQYAMEFGKAEGYAMLFGADGNGSLMYAKEGYDVSEQVIVFINNRYNGKN